LAAILLFARLIRQHLSSDFNSHNPTVVGSNPTPTTKIIDSQGLAEQLQQALPTFGKDLGSDQFPLSISGHPVPKNSPNFSAASRLVLREGML
jgi:hypothetical protein